MEDDPALCSPQLWAGRIRKDGADALAYGCTGLLGIHWRTRILGPNVSALAKAAWDQKGWNPALGAPAAPKVRVPEGPVAGQPAQFPNNAIAETDDDPLYQTVRYDVDAYNLDVPNGAYTVTLKFCEPHYAEKGRRVFGVKLQGKTVIDRLDIFEKVGKDKALDFTFKDVQVTDGRLAIDFVRQVEFPSIAAIVVEGPVTRKINCGGPAYKDFQADWPASAFGTTRNRFLPVGDFYADWALAQFGPEVAEPAAKIFNEIDGRLPRPTNWVNGPGGIAPDGRPWDEVAREFAFVDDLAALRPQVRGPGNLERFDYWLNNFRYMRSNAQVNCTWARFNAAIEKAKTAATPEAKKKAARDLALPVRKELVAQAAEMHRYLLATVTTYGELGNVTNWQQHDLPMLLYDPGQELAKLLGEDLPADAVPGKDYQGEPRLFVPTVRTSLVSGEPLRLTAMVAGAQPASVDLCWRPLGTGQFTKVPLAHVARGVWRVTLPAETATADLEYYIQAPLDGGRTLFFPPTAPQLNQTVVVVGEK